MESRASLTSHIVNNIKQDLSSQVAQIAGSLALFGSPVGFANKIGHGVKVSHLLNIRFCYVYLYACTLYMLLCFCVCVNDRPSSMSLTKGLYTAHKSSS